MRISIKILPSEPDRPEKLKKGTFYYAETVNDGNRLIWLDTDGYQVCVLDYRGAFCRVPIDSIYDLYKVIRPVKGMSMVLEV